MTRVVVLDAGPLGLLTNPKRTEETIAIAEWAIGLAAAGHAIVVPAIADFEVRRELHRAEKAQSIARLDAFAAAEPGRYLPLTDEAVHLAAVLWAQARRRGMPTADPHDLDCDVILAAQALSMDTPADTIVVATTNPGHLTQFLAAERWQDIGP